MNLDDISVASIDVETTGLDPVKDRIITLGVFRRDAQGYISRGEWKVNPGISIPSESSKIHGITDDMVKDWPHFAEVAKAVLSWLVDCKGIFTGYNLRQLDIPIIIEELERAGLGGKWPPQDMIVIDANAIFRQKEPRDLTAAVAKFCGRKHEGAHGALADAEASYDVLRGQLAHYSDLAAMGAKELSEWCGMKSVVDWAGTMMRREDGVICYTHRKVNGVPVLQDPGYGEWMLRNNFSSDTKRHLRAILNQVNANEAHDAPWE